MSRRSRLASGVVTRDAFLERHRHSVAWNSASPAVCCSRPPGRPRSPPGRAEGAAEGAEVDHPARLASRRTHGLGIAGGAAVADDLAARVHRGGRLKMPPRVPRSTIPPVCVQENAWRSASPAVML